MLIVRSRYIGDGMREDIAIHNTARLPATIMLTLTAGADFAKVKAGLAQPSAAVQATATDSALTFHARRNQHSHALIIQGDGNPTPTPGALSWRAVVPARGEWLVTVEVIPAHPGRVLAAGSGRADLVVLGGHHVHERTGVGAVTHWC